MAPLSGFSDNPFRTRSDIIRAARALAEPLHQYKSRDSARIKISTSTGAGFSETAAQLEGFARPLWIIADLLPETQSLDTDSFPESFSAQLQTWIVGLEHGVDPQSLEYWGDLSNFDQRAVEMESIAYALLLKPDYFSFPGNEKTRDNLAKWLKQINNHMLPQSNWLWFRVLVNLALVKTLGVPLAEVKHHIDDSLKKLDSFYIGDGWSSDGLWSDERKQADYYSGSFAIQFVQLLYVRFAPEYDLERTERYKIQASDFAKGFWRYFAPDGAAIPFGRSLTYRFAFAAFWSVAVVTNVALPAPINDIGTVKGLLLRHLRWWAKQPHIFNTDGTLNIGFAYPNMYLAEDYNSPQSVYWALKSFLIMGAHDSHPFWASEELPYPKIGNETKEVEMVWPPRHLICNTPEHTSLLSSGQSTNKRFKAREAKYGKFAYSSSFGFSVPCGSFLEQIAPDSTLAVSFNDGEEHWKVRYEPYDVMAGQVTFGEETLPTLVSSWKPWKSEQLVVRTALLSPSRKWPSWSLRVHRVSWTPHDTNAAALCLVDGGFAASAQTSEGLMVSETEVTKSIPVDSLKRTPYGWWIAGDSSLVFSESGASGVMDLTSGLATGARETAVESRAIIIRADPNTNLIAQRSMIPASQHILKRERTPIVFTFITGIFAVASSSLVTKEETWKLWSNCPKGRITINDAQDQIDFRI